MMLCCDTGDRLEADIAVHRPCSWRDLQAAATLPATSSHTSQTPALHLGDHSQLGLHLSTPYPLHTTCTELETFKNYR